MDEVPEDMLKAIFGQIRSMVLVYIRSKTAAMPNPPPPQMVSRPYRALRRFIS